MVKPMDAEASNASGFVITGKHVLIAIIIFFSVIITVNVIMVRLALKSYPGEQVEKSYMQGLRYNEVLAERAEQTAIGWRAEMTRTPTASEPTQLAIRLVDASGAAVVGVSLTGSLYRPTTDEGHLELDFNALGDGRYQVDLADLGPGNWNLSLIATRDDVTEFTAERRLWIE